MTEMTPKGVRDFLPKDKIVRDRLINVLKMAFEVYGYNPVETPALERMEILASKFAGGEEIMKEIFKLKDQGGRELGLRYDLTVPFARLIAMNPELKMPFKRYQIDRVWRDGPIKLGRYREFMQADADIVGTKSLLAEAELLSIAKTVFSKLNLDIVIEVNNRKLLNKIIEVSGVKDSEAVILSLDKLEKIGKQGVEKELTEKGLNKNEIEKIMNFVAADNLEELENKVGKCEGIDELKELMDLTKKFGVEIKINPTLARGLSYYTGMVYEGFLKKSKIKSSIFSGGRFDNMIGKLSGKEDMPAVGISFGIDVISDAIKLEEKNETRKSVVQTYIVPIGDVLDDAIEVLQKLRMSGVKADIDLMNRGISKNLSYANSYKIPFVVFLGQNEVDVKKVKLRDMEKGEEKLLSVDDVVSLVK